MTRVMFVLLTAMSVPVVALMRSTETMGPPVPVPFPETTMTTMTSPPVPMGLPDPAGMVTLTPEGVGMFTEVLVGDGLTMKMVEPSEEVVVAFPPGGSPEIVEFTQTEAVTQEKLPITTDES